MRLGLSIMMSFAPVWVMGVLLLLGPSKVVFGAECNAIITPITTNEFLGYQARGGRCEGLYERPVSSTGLRIAGFHSTVPNFAPTALIAHIQSDSVAEKQLVVTSTRRRMYYRMDTRLKDDQTPYPLNIVRHPDVNLTAEDLAALACIKNCQGLLPTLSPVAIRGWDVGEEDPYVLLQATESLSQLRVVFSDVEDNKPVYSRQFLEEVTWPAWRPIRIYLPEEVNGLESVRFSATSVGSTPSQRSSVSVELMLEP